jgi:hypothetical protein
MCITLDTAAAGISSQPTPADLRQLDTSFSRLLAHAFSKADPIQSQLASANSASDDGEEDGNKPPTDVYWRETNTKKPTLGEWFQKIVGDMQKEIDAQDDDFKGPTHVDPRTGKAALQFLRIR